MDNSQPKQPQPPVQAQLELEQLDNMGINMQELLDEFRLSKDYVSKYTTDFKQLDDLVDGVPLNPDPQSPFVGDTTLPGLVRSIPRTSLQQLPVLSCRINGSKYTIPALLATYLLKRTAFNEDTFGKGLLSTLQVGAEQALTHGYAAFMCAIGQMFNDFGTSLRLIHFSDTSPEPGITDHNETGFDFVTANLTPTRVRRTLKQAEKNENTSWNVPALKRLLEQAPRAKDYSQFESAAKQNQSGQEAGPTYAIITRYETGPDATIITFCEEVPEAPLRVMNSRSKWGYPRVQYLVIDPAALTPFGISRVRLASPNQNMMNIYYGNIAAMLLINSDPPLLKRGRFTKPVQLKRRAVWETSDPQASVDLKNLDNGALESFVPFAQQFAAQIQNIMGGQTQTVNAGSKSSGFSKTAPGVKQAQDYMDTSTNQVTKILENFLRQYALVALDTLLSEQEGVDRIIVDDETKDAINRVALNNWMKKNPGADPAAFVEPIGDDNKIEIDWQRFYEAIEEWSVDIDVSLTPDELKDQKRSDLQDMLVVLAQNAQELGPEAVQKVKEITDMLMEDQAPLVGALGNTPLPPAQQVTAPMPSQPAAQPQPSSPQPSAAAALT